MAVSVQLPELGESVVEGTIAKWLVKEGERVERDQPLVEVTTDKVDAEVPSPSAGVVQKILVPEGETVEVGAELARIEEGAEASAGAAESAGAEQGSGAAEAREGGEESGPSTGRQAPSSGVEARAAEGESPRATPVARRMAEEQQIDLRGVRGSGPSGRITKEDLEQSPAARGAQSTPPQSSVAREGGGEAEARAPAREAPRREAPPREARGPSREAREPREPQGRPEFAHYELQEGDRVIPMTPLRRLVAEHMVYSKRTSPHVGTVAEIDMGGVVRVRERHKGRFKEQYGFSLTFMPFVVHALVRAIREYPRLNASVIEDAIVEKKEINIGIAVETEKGLVVPVVRHADRLSLSGLAEAVEDISSRARSKRLSADELKGGTFTLSNPGRQGNLYGFAIINQPQVGILRMGEIVKRPVVRTLDGEDAIVIRPMMYLALSYDHRAVDGAPANGFLYRVRELLEEADFDL